MDETNVRRVVMAPHSGTEAAPSSAGTGRATTGYTLIAKLWVVALVFALGAWNWRRQRPTLGSEAAAASIRRSATAELTVAAIVLVITAVLVSLPSPRPPGEPRTSPVAVGTAR